MSHRDSETNPSEGTGIYIHIPYCRRRCSYCDFAIVPIGNQSKSEKWLSGFQKMDESYRKAITSEIDLLNQSLKGEPTCLSSIYLGGGTPSLAPLDTIQEIFDHIFSQDGSFYLHDEAEVTIEMDPGTFTKEHLLSLKQIGINRISLGVQSFDDSILEGIGRVHRNKDIVEALKHIQDVFGDTGANYSMDLISGLPGLTLDRWEETLKSALALKPAPNHLSIYDLQIEEGTTFGKWYADYDQDEEADADADADNSRFESTKDMTKADLALGTNHLPLPFAADCADMYKRGSEFMREMGFEHYEISSYARIKDFKNSGLDNKPSLESHRSKHNQIYWKVQSTWFAVGLSATSSVNGKRFARPRTMADYIQWVESQHQNGLEGNKSPEFDWMPAQGTINQEDKDDIILDTIMTRLRTIEGLDLNWIASKDNGNELLECVMRGSELGLELGLAEIVPGHLANSVDRGFLRLTDPQGFLFSNNVISSIFAELP
jgi:coproporphyrinogen III oxidase-like Fe-S oxidoreductase